MEGSDREGENETSRARGHTERADAPLRLNRLVNVLPQPGTGHTKLASFLRRLALAACVALVVTCCFSTCMMGGRRGKELEITEDDRPRVVDGAAPDGCTGGSCCDCA